MRPWLKKKKSKYTKHYAGSFCFLFCLIEWKLRHTTKSHNHKLVKIHPRDICDIYGPSQIWTLKQHSPKAIISGVPILFDILRVT